MKLPICYFDAKTKILCPLCKKKLESGEISELDVNLAHDLIELEEKEFPQLKKAEFHKAFKIGDVVFILVKGSPEISETVWRRLARRLSKMNYGRVRIIEKSGELKQIIQKIIYPARMIGINIVYYPDGTSEYYIRVPQRDMRKLPYSQDIIERAIKMITGMKVKIMAEKI